MTATSLAYAASEKCTSIPTPADLVMLRDVFACADPTKWITVTSIYNLAGEDGKPQKIVQNYHYHAADVPSAVKNAVERGNDVYFGKVDRCGVRAVEGTISGYLVIDIDIDCHAAGATYNPFRIANDLMFLPIKPHYIVDSGRGVHALYLLQRCHARSSSGTSMDFLYRHVADAVCKMVTPILPAGCELDRAVACNPNQVTRAIGSYNHKARKPVTVLVQRTTPRYDLRELYDELCKKNWKADNAAKAKAKAPALSKVTYLRNNMLPLHQQRLKLMHDLVEQRHGNCDGYRDKILYQTWYWALMCNGLDIPTAKAIVLNLNARFVHPLSDDEAIKCGTWSIAMAHAAARGDEPKAPFTRAGHNPSNRRIITDLAITPVEQQALGIHPVGGHDARDAARQGAREAKWQQQQKQYAKLIAKGASTRHIASALHISLRDVKKLANAHAQAVTDISK